MPENGYFQKGAVSENPPVGSSLTTFAPFHPDKNNTLPRNMIQFGCNKDGLRGDMIQFGFNTIQIYSSITVTNSHNWSSRSFWMSFFLCARLVIHALISYSLEKLTFKLISNSFYCQTIKIWLQYPTMKVLLIVICVANQIKQKIIEGHDP